MRSWIKALLISVIILTTCLFFLPYLAKSGLNSLVPWIMQQADLEQESFHIGQLTWRKLTIDEIQLTAVKQNAEFHAQKIEVTFSPSSLLDGRIFSASVQKARLKILPTQAGSLIQSKAANQANTQIKPATPQELLASSDQPAVILRDLQSIFQQLPFDTITIEEFEFTHPQGTVTSSLVVNKKALTLTNTIDSPLLKKNLLHSLTLDQQGDLKSAIFIAKQPVPIFNLQANWSVHETNKHDEVRINLQQTADIQSWIELVSTDEHKKELNANIAIQATNLNISLPRKINSLESIINQLAAEVSAQGLLQIKIDGLDIYDQSQKSTLIKGANVAINIQTDIDPRRDEQWQFTIDTLDFSSAINDLTPIDITLKQTLKDAITIGCTLLPTQQTCHWQGSLVQSITGDQLTHTTQLSLDGDFTQFSQDDASQAKKASSDTPDSHFISRQSLQLQTSQKNSLWPKGSNITKGEIIFQGQHVENNWHWQLSLPFGLNNQSRYFDPIMLTDGKKTSKAHLSDIHWQLLPDWQVSGIDGEIINSKPLGIVIDQLKLQHNKRSVELDNASLSCNLDWLKLQYSPQLRSQQALAELPLSCHWQLKNKASHWQQWPIPAFTFSGDLTLSSLDFKIAKLDTRMQLIGLSDTLDLTLLAQHNFNGVQTGSAQLYLNNLKLDWKKLGLKEMQNLTQVQLLEGSVSAQGWFKWQQYQTDIFDENSLAWRWQPDVMLRIDDMAGIYQEVTTWQDLDIQLAIRRPFYQDFRIDSQISALSVHPGIEVNNILARSTTTIKDDFTQALIVIEEVHSDVLGGRINVPLIRYDTSQEVNSFGIEVEGLELEQIAALEAGSGIEATGKLDGVLPIILLAQGPQVPAGTLLARAPGGTVKYKGQSAESLKQSDPSVSLAMQVLDDFRYDKLQTDVTYQPDGELILGLQFQGHNPTFFDGQATHLNLNLEYNLLDLLESLRISNEVVEKLENKYQ